MDQAPLEIAIEAAGEFARDVDKGRSEAERLDLGVELVVELIDSCDHVGITAFGPKGVQTVAASSEKSLQCEQLQYDLNEGPLLDTVRTHQTAISNDVALDRRWPTWGPGAAERYGVLNLYSDQPQAYNSEDLLTAEALAAHLAVAASNGRELDHRGVAIVNRTMIGQAEGVLMERYKVTAEQAFAMLREQSQRTNRKLARIAEELTSTGKWEHPPG